jgi:hypothetical protein
MYFRQNTGRYGIIYKDLNVRPQKYVHKVSILDIWYS